ncbi:hypothetical protein K9M79_05915 [Candidatus Woesearchaeota archaeon]|nr:hypothetical protein [Candidatus Woesearchaeota archaeon]
MAIQVIEESEPTVSNDALCDLCMYEIQKRMVDIGMLKEDKKPVQEQVTDMFLLCKKLVEMHSVDQDLIADRIQAIEETVKNR